MLATALVIAGIARRSRLLQYSSLAVMVPAVVKVFVYDTAQLRDLYRVASLFALGVSLFLLVFLYQRYVFRRPEGRTPPDRDGEDPG